MNAPSSSVSDSCKETICFLHLVSQLPMVTEKPFVDSMALHNLVSDESGSKYFSNNDSADEKVTQGTAFKNG